jgi:hypothetical protein
MANKISKLPRMAGAHCTNLRRAGCGGPASAFGMPPVAHGWAGWFTMHREETHSAVLPGAPILHAGAAGSQSCRVCVPSV